MLSTAFEEAMQRVSSSLGKIGSKSVSSDVFHLVLVRQGRNGALRVLPGELLVQEDEVGEASADFDQRLLKRSEVCLQEADEQKLQ